MHFPKVPLHIKCSHPPRAKIGEQIQCEYTIRNLTDDILSVQVRMDDDSQAFLFAGEQLSQIQLMPCDDTYVLSYTLVPTKLGMQPLPNFSILPLPSQKVQERVPQTIKYWLKNFTSKVFVSSV